ncbi:hypothetical protein MTR_3g077600 [Medicago truncatula]|uniref:Uncharacterized protein n=1 Tax=Medicago truncatula TaxID=3880 RepID=G7J5E1_MEDTR|nr:hypothetical protein MTR_3g077600 [Medicago truncatula]
MAPACEDEASALATCVRNCLHRGKIDRKTGGNFDCKTGGLIRVVPWNSLQPSVASAFLAILYSNYMLTSHIETLYCSGKKY